MTALPLVVLVTGTTGTGKTTLAHSLAERFGLPLFYKDGFKERMFEIACPSGDYANNFDREFSRLLGRFSLGCLEVALEQCVHSGINAVFEANFDSHLFSPHLSALRERCPFTLVQVRLHCESQILTERFLLRERTDRHPGHGGIRHLGASPDVLRQQLEGLLRDDKPLAMEPGDDLFEFDTTDLMAIEYGPLYAAITRRLMQKN